MNYMTIHHPRTWVTDAIQGKVSRACALPNQSRLTALPPQPRQSLSQRMATTTQASTMPAAAQGTTGPQTPSAAAKHDAIWQEITASKYQGDLPQFTGTEPLFMFTYLLPGRRNRGKEFMNVTMDLQQDTFPVGRPKGIHTYGSVAKVELVADSNQPFTGMFQGAQYGLARLSLAAKPGKTSTTPGMAVKFFVDGSPSINLQVMHSLDSQESYNFFEHKFSNKLAEPKGFALKILQKVFEMGSIPATEVGLKAAAAVTQAGEAVAPASQLSPVQLVLVPKVGPFAHDAHEVRDDFASIPAGSELYEIWGKAADTNDLVKIGQLVTRSEFVCSEFGDKHLFFKHIRPDQ